MRAAVFHGARDVRIERVSDPRPAEGEVVLEVVRAAICGTDSSEWDRGPILSRPGVVLGHEFVGRIVARGEGVNGIAIGDRVVSGAGISCGSCRWCRAGRTNLCAEYRTLGLQVDGGLAQYVATPTGICWAVPDSCDDDAAAVAQPFAVALHALRRIEIGHDDAIAIVGVGGIGAFLVAGAVTRAVAGRVVAVDIDPARLAIARALGAHETVDAFDRDLGELLLELTEGVGFDAVIEASGAADAPLGATVGVRRGGRVLIVGLQAAPRELDLAGLALREVDISTAVAHVCDVDIPAALDLLADNRIAQTVIGSCIPLDALVERGLRPLAEHRLSAKIIVDPTTGP